MLLTRNDHITASWHCQAVVTIDVMNEVGRVPNRPYGDAHSGGIAEPPRPRTGRSRWEGVLGRVG